MSRNKRSYSHNVSGTTPCNCRKEKVRNLNCRSAEMLVEGNYERWGVYHHEKQHGHGMVGSWDSRAPVNEEV